MSNASETMTGPLYFTPEHDYFTSTDRVHYFVRVIHLWLMHKRRKKTNKTAPFIQSVFLLAFISKPIRENLCQGISSQNKEGYAYAAEHK